MRHITESHAAASEHQRGIRELRIERGHVAEAGNLVRLEEIEIELAELDRLLATARATVSLAQCRHCGVEFVPDDYVELVINAIVLHKPLIEGEETQTEMVIYPRGEERHLVYCPGCAAESRLLEYLTKR